MTRMHGRTGVKRNVRPPFFEWRGMGGGRIEITGNENEGARGRRQGRRGLNGIPTLTFSIHSGPRGVFQLIHESLWARSTVDSRYLEVQGTL